MSDETHPARRSGGTAEPERQRKPHAARSEPASQDGGEVEEPVELLIRVPLHDEPEPEPAAAADEPAAPGMNGAEPDLEPGGLDRIRTGPPPEPDAASRIRFARLLLRSGSLMQARAQYEALAATEDLDGPGLLDLAEVRWRTGDLMGAGSAAAAYVTGGGDQALGFLIAAEAAAGIGRQVEARRNAEMVEKLAPDLDALFAGVPRHINWNHGTTTPPPVAIQIEVPGKPEAQAEPEAGPAPLPPAETLWKQIEEVAVAAEKAAAEKAEAEKAEAEKAAAEAAADKPEATPAVEQAVEPEVAEPPAQDAAVAEPAEPAPAQPVEPVETPAEPPEAIEVVHPEPEPEVEPVAEVAESVAEVPPAEPVAEVPAPAEPVAEVPAPAEAPAPEEAPAPAEAPAPEEAPAPAEAPAPEEAPAPAEVEAEPVAEAPAASPEPETHPWDGEVAAGTAALEAADPLLAALHYAVALRMSPQAARAVLDSIGERRDLALELVRVDALRLAGNESDAGAVEAQVASKLQGRTAAPAPATPEPEKPPARPEPPKKKAPEPPPIRWE